MEGDRPEEPEEPVTPENRIAFDYIKAANFRAIRADGAIGGVTPAGQIHLALYSERLPIPRRTVHDLDKSGQLGKAIESETIKRDAIVREMEIDVFVNIDVARNLHTWLGQKIVEWERARDLSERSSEEDSK